MENEITMTQLSLQSSAVANVYAYVYVLGGCPLFAMPQRSLVSHVIAAVVSLSKLGDANMPEESLGESTDSGTCSNLREDP